MRPPLVGATRAAATQMRRPELEQGLQLLFGQGHPSVVAVEACCEGAHWCTILPSLISDGSVMGPRCCQVIALLA